MSVGERRLITTNSKACCVASPPRKGNPGQSSLPMAVCLKTNTFPHLSDRWQPWFLVSPNPVSIGHWAENAVGWPITLR